MRKTKEDGEPKALRAAAARLLGSKGGKSTAAKMSGSQRRARAKKAAAARWAKRDEK